MILERRGSEILVVSLIGIIQSLSIISLGFILHLALKSRATGSHHLQAFSSLWAVRSTLVLTISLWALSHLLRSRPFVTPLLCKLHVALSLGLLQPAFLLLLLFLLHLSAASRRRHSNGRRALASLAATCSPLFSLQVLLLFFFSGDLAGFLSLSPYFWRSHVSSAGDGAVVCSYPLLSTAVFGSFAAGYCVVFLVSAWRVVSLVINKALRLRIYVLVVAVLVSLPAQVLLMGLSGIWRPEEAAYDIVALVVFLLSFCCAVVGEGVLVIKPIADSLAVWGQCRCVVCLGPMEGGVI